MAIDFNKQTLDAEMVLGDTGTFSIAPKINKQTFLSDGDEIWFTLKKRKENTIVLQKTITKFDNGVATIPIPPADTINMEPGNYIYDLKLIRKDGNVDTLLPNNSPSANFTLKKGVK